mmetsp:Transcript_12389/g.29767  ORF Transcript_12389/g.29767 Transcript_12389/m.29767 type:complete len:439 (+) Transcript_12389:38-1354(+)
MDRSSNSMDRSPGRLTVSGIRRLNPFPFSPLRTLRGRGNRRRSSSDSGRRSNNNPTTGRSTDDDGDAVPSLSPTSRSVAVAATAVTTTISPNRIITDSEEERTFSGDGTGTGATDWVMEQYARYASLAAPLATDTISGVPSFQQVPSRQSLQPPSSSLNLLDVEDDVAIQQQQSSSSLNVLDVEEDVTIQQQQPSSSLNVLDVEEDVAIQHAVGVQEDLISASSSSENGDLSLSSPSSQSSSSSSSFPPAVSIAESEEEEHDPFTSTSSQGNASFEDGKEGGATYVEQEVRSTASPSRPNDGVEEVADDEAVHAEARSLSGSSRPSNSSRSGRLELLELARQQLQQRCQGIQQIQQYRQVLQQHCQVLQQLSERIEQRRRELEGRLQQRLQQRSVGAGQEDIVDNVGAGQFPRELGDEVNDGDAQKTPGCPRPHELFF